MATTWTAYTVAEALDLLDATKTRLESGATAAYPGISGYDRTQATRTTPINLRITFDTSELDRIAAERTTFDDQIHSNDPTRL